MPGFVPSAGEDDEVFGELLNPNDDQPFIFHVEDEPEDETTILKSRLDTMERENAAYKAAQNVRPNMPSFEDGYQPPRQQAPVQQQNIPSFDHATLNKQIETDLFSGNALGVFQKFNGAAVELSKQEIKNQLTPLKASMVRQQVSFFKQNASMEPEVAKRFDKMVKQYNDEALAAVDPNLLPDLLTNMKRLAFAEAYEEGYVPPQQRRAPMYGGGPGGSSALPKGQKSMKLTQKQQDAVKVAREDYGWDDKMIYDALKSGDLDG